MKKKEKIDKIPEGTFDESSGSYFREDEDKSKLDRKFLEAFPGVNPELLFTKKGMRDEFNTYASRDMTGDANVQYLRNKVHFFEKRIESADPFKMNPYLELETKADIFLKSHADMSYNDFVNEVDFNKLESGDYVYLGKRGLKKRLFKIRSQYLLAALAEGENEGRDYMDLVSALGRSEYYPIIKPVDKPIIDKILDVVK